MKEATQLLSQDGRAVAVRRRNYRLRVFRAGREETRVVEQPLLRAGSEPGNDLVLSDPAISRIHFEIAIDEHGFRLTDLGSTNGTVVDGYRVGSLYLRPSSNIVAGRTEIEFTVLPDESESPLSEAQRLEGLVGQSVAMRELFARLEQVAATDYPVLIEGETGTGKELVADAIHRRSRRAGGPLVALDCGAVSPALLESTLFGHERGAFTGAVQRHVGFLEEADGGTLFLDELGELPLELQPKLLRALAKQELRRIGGTQVLSFDARIIAATNRDLAREINRGAFRADLYYRIAVIQLRLPPLRERPDDIPLLVEHFLRQALPDDIAVEQALHSIGDDGWDRLARHPWPGNLRELQNVVHRMLALAEAPLEDDAPTPVAPPTLPPPDPGDVDVPVDLDLPYADQRNALLAGFEKRYLLGLLSRHEGNYSAAARAAGIDRMHFRRLVRKYE